MSYDDRYYSKPQSPFNRLAVGFLLVACCALMTLALFGAFGGAGDMVKRFLIGTIGLTSYAYTIGGFIIGIAVMAGKKVTLPVHKTLKYLLLFVLGIVVLHIWSGRPAFIEASSYGEYLGLCYRGDTAGGIIAGLFMWPVMKVLSVTVTLVLFMVLFFTVTLLSFYPLLKGGSNYRTRKTKIEGRPKQPSMTAFGKEVVSTPVQKSVVGGELFMGSINEDEELEDAKKATKRDKKEFDLNLIIPIADSQQANEQSIQPVLGEEDRKKRARDRLFKRGKITDSDVDVDNIKLSQQIPDRPNEPKSSIREYIRSSRLGPVQPYYRGSDNPQSIYERFNIEQGEDADRREVQTRYRDILESDLSESDILGSGKHKKAPPAPPVKEEPKTVDEPQIMDLSETEKPDIYSGKKFMKTQPGELPAAIQDILEGDVRAPEKGLGRTVQPNPDNMKKEEPAPEIIPEPPKPVTPPPASTQESSRPNSFFSRSLEYNPTSEPPAPIKYGGATGSQVTEFVPEPKQPTVPEPPKEEPKVRPLEDIKPYEVRGAVKPVAEEEIKAEEPEEKEVDNSFFARAMRGAKPNPVQPAKPVDTVRPSILPTGTSRDYVGSSAEAVVVDNDSVMPSKEDMIDAPKPPRQPERMPTNTNADTSFVGGNRPIGITPSRPVTPPAPKKELTQQVTIEDAFAAKKAAARPYVAPPLSLLSDHKSEVENVEDLNEMGAALVEKLSEFRINVELDNITRGPTFSRFEIKLAAGIRISRIKELEDDLASALCVDSIRVEPVRGRTTIGIEIPNHYRDTVSLKSLLSASDFNIAKSPLTFGLGRDISGSNFVCDIHEMPHLLIAGATGSGKSVCINSLILSLIYKASPDDVRLILVDPKMVELSIFNNMPHLLLKNIVCDADKAVNALQWAIDEMQRRYIAFTEHEVKNIDDYNNLANQSDDLQKMCKIVFIIDELADLIMQKKREIEDKISKLTRLSRAAGIYLVVATQRPSTDYITGSIKANLPSKIAFAVSSNVDSRIIIDRPGAEKLLGKGDMLYFPRSEMDPIRLQGCFVSGSEVSAVINYIRQHNDSVYDDNIDREINYVPEPEPEIAADTNNNGGEKGEDPLFREALVLCINEHQASVSRLQRKFSIGFARAARIIDTMQERGWVAASEQGNKAKKVLITMDDYRQIFPDDDVDDDYGDYNG